MRRLAYIVCAGLCICAAAVVSTAERLFDWLLGVLPFEAPAFAFDGELVPARRFSGFADPHVERHEAGMSRRAARRGI